MKNKKSWVYIAFVLFALAATCCAVVTAGISFFSGTEAVAGSKLCEADGWTSSDGSPAQTLFLSEKASMKLTLTEDTAGKVFLFRSYFADVKVLLNGEQISSEPDKAVASLGYLPYKINIVSAEASKPGDELTLEITGMSGLSSISRVYCGTSGAITAEEFARSVIGIAFSVALVFGAAIIFLIHRIFRSTEKNTSSLLFVGWFALLAGLLGIFSSDVFIASISANAFTVPVYIPLLFLLPVPILICADDRIHYGAMKIVLRMLIFLDLLASVSSYILVMTKLVPIGIMTIVAYGLDFVNGFIFIPAVCSRSRNGQDGKSKGCLLCAAILLVGIVLDVTVNAVSYGTFFAIAAIAVVFITAFINVSSVTGMLEIAERAEAIGKLAYTDSLTGVGNPTAFKEKLSRLELTKENYDSIGIIQFDVNNLKTTNDTLGHNIGDDMIMNGARIIHAAFGKAGNVYRVGGDEFTAIVAAEHAPMLCDEAAQKFENMIDEFNQTQKKKYKLQIAYGIAFYENDDNGRETFLKDVQKIADSRMYAKKKQMKEKNGEEIRSTVSDNIQ